MPKGIYDRSTAKPNKGMFKNGHIPTIGAFKKGHKNSTEAKRKMSEHWKKVFKDETKHPRWRDEKAGYGAKHQWIYKQYGKATKCDNDKSHIFPKYEWSNISGNYLRDINDWRQLCITCHRRYDVKSTKLKEYEKRS